MAAGYRPDAHLRLLPNGPGSSDRAEARCYDSWKPSKRVPSLRLSRAVSSACWIQLVKVRKHRAAAAVRIPVDADSSERSLGSLQSGICLQADSLRVDFRCAEDLLSKLYELSQPVGNDFDGFKALVERPA